MPLPYDSLHCNSDTNHSININCLNCTPTGSVAMLVLYNELFLLVAVDETIVNVINENSG